jgi:uncharacterized protein DUF3309
MRAQAMRIGAVPECGTLPRRKRLLASTVASEATMLTTILIVILILMLIGALPTWGYSRNWGYGPGGGLGLILIIVLILALTGRV